MITFTYLHEEDNVVLTAGTKTPDLRREAALCGCEYKLCSSAVDFTDQVSPRQPECWQETRGRCQVVETRLSKTNFQGMYSHSQGCRGSWKTWNSIYVRWEHLFVCDSLTYHGALHLNQEAPEVRFQTLKVRSTSSARLIPLSTSVTAVKHSVGTSVLFVSHQIRAAHSSVPR